MKKILFLLLLISTYSYGQYTSIPDINFEKTLIKLGYDDATPDGRILTSRINKIEYLDVSLKFIEDLTGIEDFTSLRNLYCNSNKLTTLNITKNFFLATLECNSNNLKSLNISNNISMTNLNCSNNKISSLDITQNINLKVIDFSFNQLTKIDTSNNKILISLSCSNNILTDLDILKNIELRTLICSKNKLTILDISTCLYLYSLKCNNNLLYALNLKNGNNKILLNDSDFSENPNLSCIQVNDVIYSNSAWSKFKDTSATYFDGNCMEYTLVPDVNFETKLIKLKIDKDGINGKIFTFDAKKTKNLSIDNNNSMNKIEDLKGIEDFVSLETLNCDGNLLETLDLSNNELLIRLNCASNKLTNLNISKNINLNELNCYDNKLVNLNTSNNVNLQYLYCHKNQLINLNVDKNMTLNYLWCDFNQLSAINVSNNLDLKTLYCNFNQLTSINVSKNINLSDLRVSGNKISILDITKNNLLKIVALEDNQITDLNTLNNPLLSGLHCAYNQLKNIDISQNSKLTDFRCNSNNLSSLNLKNGKNTNLNDSYLDLTKNPNLTCIQVDNDVYSKTNWNTKKDVIASFSTTCSLGTKDSVFFKLNIFPNPTKGDLFIENISVEKATLYNTSGQFIKTNLFTTGSITNKIDLSGLSKGVYYIYLENEGNTTVRKVILN